MRSCSTYLALASLFLTACGTTAGDGDLDMPDAGDEDTTSPSVVSASPADGATGVRGDVEVVFVFSEPMDTASVEGTLDAGDLGDVTLRWNADGDTLTITPDAPLLYAEGTGTDLAAVTALQYAVVIGTGALDLAGNPITAGHQTIFETLRHMDAVFELDLALTGSVSPLDALAEGDTIGVGDTNDNVAYYGFFTFDLATLPPSAIEITAATFSTRQLGAIGFPYTVLGDRLKIEHLSFGALDNAAFNAAPRAALGDFAELDQVTIGHDVTVAAEDDRAQRAARTDRSQYRLRFEAATNADSAADFVGISRDLSELQVSYLAP
jgi:predicted small secreted protein